MLCFAMSKKNKYIVTSSTARCKEGYPHLCWMDIGVAKLQSAAEEGKDYLFVCHIGADTFEYTYPAQKLLRIFEQKEVRVKGASSPRYTFFIEYAAGVLYHCLTNGADSDDMICSLNPQTTYKAHEKLESAVQELSSNPFPFLIARTALWATADEYKECLAKGHTAKAPHVRRKKANEVLGWDADEKIYLDSNCFPNSQMKASLKKRSIIPIGYETCHIWEGTCYETEYHTCYANLVLLPRALASLSDHDENIRDILKYRAYELFGFTPKGKPKPHKPTNYPDSQFWLSI